MGPVGVPEMVVIFLVALVLFGPKKLPELGKMLGKAISEFRRAQSELKATFEREMHNLEREANPQKEKMCIRDSIPYARSQLGPREDPSRSSPQCRNQ